MYSALYYPHTEVQSEDLVKRALVTWDKLETVVPDPYYRPQYEGTIAEAMEMIGGKRDPTDGEKEKVHELVKDLIESGVPETFTYRPDSSGDQYDMWPGKLAPRTWQLLGERGLIRPPRDNVDIQANKPAGLTVMSIVADVMAGDTRARVTDQEVAYATIANAPVPGARPADATNLEHVIPLTFKTINVERVPLQRLIDFRRRAEASSSAHDYRAMRHKYVDSLAEHAKEVAPYPLGTADRTELDEQFQQQMEDDLAALKDELGVAKTDAILSKESIALIGIAGLALAAFISGGLAAVPLAIVGAVKSSGVVATVGGPLLMAHRYGIARRKTLRDHPMAYLYEAAT